MTRSILTLAALAVCMWSIGCGDDPPTAPSAPTPAPSATIEVDPDPDSGNAPWQLTGPGSYVHDGQGDETLSDLGIGEYSLTWGAVTGWDSPSPISQTRAMADGDSWVIGGTYTLQLGTIIVDAEPSTIQASWQLTGPDGYTRSGQGDETIPALSPGEYTIAWGAVLGWDRPSPASESQNLTSVQPLTFAGSYVGQPGTVGLQLTNVNASQSGYVRISDDDALEPQVFTIEAWITPQGTGYGGTTDAAGAALISKPMESTTGSWLGSWMLGWSPSNESIYFAVVHQARALGTQIDTAPQVVPLGTTAHIAATFDGTTLKIYVDGSLEATGDFPYSGVYYGDEDVLIGAANFGSGYLRRFDGVIDEMRLWDHARTAEDIATDMNCHFLGTKTGLLAQWGFESSDLSDDTSGGHDGVAEGVGAVFVAPEVSVSTCP